MKRILALVLALMLCLGAAALAEGGNAYVLQIDDPKLYEYGNHDSATLDASGLRLQFSILTDNEDTVGVDVAGYVGEARDLTVARARFQLDPKLMALTADGLGSVYSMPVPGGDEAVPALVAALQQATSRLHSQGMSAEERADVRRQFIEGNLLAPYVTGSEETAEGTLHTFHMEGKLDELIGANGGAPVASAADAADLDEMRIRLDGTCLLSGDGTKLAIEGEGVLALDDGSEMPLHLTVDDQDTDFSLAAEARTGETALVLSAVGLVDPETYHLRNEVALSANGMNAFELVLDQEDVTEGGAIDFSVRFGTNSFAFKGVKEDMGLSGTIVADFDYEGTRASFSTDIHMGVVGADDADWKLDTSGAVDVATMSDGQKFMLVMGVTGIAGNALSRIQENVPALAPLMNQLLGGVTGMLG